MGNIKDAEILLGWIKNPNEAIGSNSEFIYKINKKIDTYFQKKDEAFLHIDVLIIQLDKLKEEIKFINTMMISDLEKYGEYQIDYQTDMTKVQKEYEIIFNKIRNYNGDYEIKF